MRRRSWPFYLLTICLFSLLAVSPGYARSAPRTSDAFVPGELIVRLHPRVDPRSFAAGAGLGADSSQFEQLRSMPVYRFRIVDGTSPREKAAGLAADPSVIYAEPNYLGQIPEARRRSLWVVGSSAEQYVEQWAPQRMRLPEAHAVTRGAGIVVALLDTGVDVEHPAFAGRLERGYDFFDVDNDPREVPGVAPDSAFGHGTHVAGLIALSAPEARLLPLRTLGPDGTGDLWTQVLALRYAAEQGAHVVNLSFSFAERSRLFEDVIAEVTCASTAQNSCRRRGRTGAVVVAAAGNSGAHTREWPGASTVPGLVTVAASTEHDTLADFSNFGGWVHIAAPGEAIISTVPGGAYALWSGTSMATPLVSGVAALVRANNAALRPLDVVKYVVESASPIQERVRCRVDAAAALTYIPEE